MWRLLGRERVNKDYQVVFGKESYIMTPAGKRLRLERRIGLPASLFLIRATVLH